MARGTERKIMDIKSILNGIELPSDEDIKKETANLKKSITLKSYGDNHASKRKDVREKISQSHTGKKYSEEIRKILSEAHKGHVPWNLGKKGLYKSSDSKKQKLSEMNRGEKNPCFRGWMVGTHKITKEEVWFDGKLALLNAKPKAMDIRNVNAAILGKIPSAYGYTWRRETKKQ